VGIRSVVGALVLLFGGLQFMGPARINPAVSPARTLHAKVPIPEDVHAVLSRSCWNCHSRETVWPWYAYVAPISWRVIGHVNEGREHLDFTNWDHSPEEGVDLLDEVCTQVKRGTMPLREYTWMHWNAVLDPKEVTRLCAWANDTADKLMASH
jgi:Haem-binding domain